MNAQQISNVRYAAKAMNAAKIVEANAKADWVSMSSNVAMWQRWQDAEDAVEAARVVYDNAMAAA